MSGSTPYGGPSEISYQLLTTNLFVPQKNPLKSFETDYTRCLKEVKQESRQVIDRTGIYETVQIAFDFFIKNVNLF